MADEPPNRLTAPEPWERGQSPNRHEAPWNAAARVQYVKYSAEGHRPDDIIHLLKVDARAVKKWLRRGADADSPSDIRKWYLDVMQARAVAKGIPGQVLTHAALGAERIDQQPVFEPDENGRMRPAKDANGAPLFQEVLIKPPPDWKAAVALDALRERQELGRDKLGLLKAQRMKAEQEAMQAQEEARQKERVMTAMVERAEADRDAARYRAQVLERTANKVEGLLMFPSTFLAQASPEVRPLIEAEMLRQGVRAAPEPMMAAEAARMDPDEAEALRELAAVWESRDAADEAEPPA